MQKQQYIYYVGWLREHFLKLYWCKKFFYKMDLKCLEKIDKAYSRPGEIPPQAIQKSGNKLWQPVSVLILIFPKENFTV